MKMKLMLDTIAARTLLVLIIGLTFSHALSVALYFTDRTAALFFTGGEHIGERIVTVEGMINRAPNSERINIASLADRSKLHVMWSKEPSIEDEPVSGWQTKVLRDAMVRHFGDAVDRTYRLGYASHIETNAWLNHFQELHKQEIVGATLFVSLKAKGDGWLNFAAPLEPPEPFWSLRFVLSLLVMLSAVAILSALVVRRLTEPLVTLAGAAQKLGVNLNAPSLPETGPKEVRDAARSFNEMQDRIRRLVDDRTRMVAAISHDLGTPITRLRLRAEFVENKEQRQKILADLGDMEVMVKSVMSFVRDEEGLEPRSIVELASLVTRVCDDMADAGNDVELVPVGRNIPYLCQPVAIRRALTNLISNAVNYGQQARVSLKTHASGIEIQIDDDGPGIAKEFQEEVFKPFQRLESSRSRETGGVGLGLSVARTIVHGHGGHINLENRTKGGLRVTVRLPQH